MNKRIQFLHTFYSFCYYSLVTINKIFRKSYFLKTNNFTHRMKTQPNKTQPLDLKQEKYAGNTNPKPSKKDFPIPQLAINSYCNSEKKDQKKHEKTL